MRDPKQLHMLQALIPAVFFLGVGLTFEPLRRSWLFMAACALVGVPAALLVNRFKESLAQRWRNAQRTTHIMVVFIATIGLWFLVFEASHTDPDRIFLATLFTVAALLLFGTYVAFSFVVDKLWEHLRRK